MFWSVAIPSRQEIYTLHENGNFEVMSNNNPYPHACATPIDVNIAHVTMFYSKRQNCIYLKGQLRHSRGYSSAEHYELFSLEYGKWVRSSSTNYIDALFAEEAANAALLGQL